MPQVNGDSSRHFQSASPDASFRWSSYRQSARIFASIKFPGISLGFQIRLETAMVKYVLAIREQEASI